MKQKFLYVFVVMAILMFPACEWYCHEYYIIYQLSDYVDQMYTF